MSLICISVYHALVHVWPQEGEGASRSIPALRTLPASGEVDPCTLARESASKDYYHLGPVNRQLRNALFLH